MSGRISFVEKGKCSSLLDYFPEGDGEVFGGGDGFLVVPPTLHFIGSETSKSPTKASSMKGVGACSVLRDDSPPLSVARLNTFLRQGSLMKAVYDSCLEAERFGGTCKLVAILGFVPDYFGGSSPSVVSVRARLLDLLHDGIIEQVGVDEFVVVLK